MSESRNGGGASLPPTHVGASAQDVLSTVLPVVIEAATKSAEGAASSAQALVAVESGLAQVREAIQKNTAEVKRLADLEQSRQDHAKETGAWLRTLFTPQTILYVLLLILGLLGIRLTIPVPLTLEVPPTQQPAAP